MSLKTLIYVPASSALYSNRDYYRHYSTPTLGITTHLRLQYLGYNHQSSSCHYLQVTTHDSVLDVASTSHHPFITTIDIAIATFSCYLNISSLTIAPIISSLTIFANNWALNISSMALPFTACSLPPSTTYDPIFSPFSSIVFITTKVSFSTIVIWEQNKETTIATLSPSMNFFCHHYHLCHPTFSYGFLTSIP